MKPPICGNRRQKLVWINNCRATQKEGILTVLVVQQEKQEAGSKKEKYDPVVHSVCSQCINDSALF